MNDFTPGKGKDSIWANPVFSFDFMDAQFIAHGVTQQEPGTQTSNLKTLIEYPHSS
jgi:hypothetical protein